MADSSFYGSNPPKGPPDGVPFVTSFNTRDGTVIPLTGDYSAAQITYSGAIPAVTTVQAALDAIAAAGAGAGVAGTVNEITVTSGGGGVPVISLPAALTFTGKTVTAGTFSAPALVSPLVTGTAAPAITFAPSSGTSLFAQVLQQGDNVYINNGGVASRFRVGLPVDSGITAYDTLNITPTTGSTRKGLDIVNVGPFAGDQSGSLDPDNGALNYNHIYVTEDAQLGSPQAYGNALGVTLALAATHRDGSRAAIFGQIDVNAASAGTAGAPGDNVGIVATARGNGSEGGTNTGAGARGTLFASSHGALLNSGATNYFLVSGAEVDVGISTGGSARHRLGWSIVGTGDVQAADYDCGLEISAAGQPFKTGILLSSLHGGPAVSATGNIIAHDGVAATCANFIYAPGYNVTGNIFQFTNFLLTGQGVAISKENPAPASPPSGTGTYWIDSTDKRLHDKNDAGTIGTTVVANTGAANQFLTAISAAGVVSRAQPSAANLSNGTTGTAGSPVVLQTSPSLTSPTVNNSDTTYNTLNKGLVWTGGPANCGIRVNGGALANNATAQLGYANNIAGFVMIIDLNSGKNALYEVKGGAAVTNEVFDSAGFFGNATGASSMNIFHDGTKYVIENKTGGATNWLCFQFVA